MKHLVRELHDVTLQPVSIWCEAPDWMRDRTQDIDEADCLDCLVEVRRYGMAASGRMDELRREAARDRGERV